MNARSQLTPFGTALLDTSAANDGRTARSGADHRHTSLSVQLRQDTQAVHASTEAAFELDQWLTNRASYAALLIRMWRFHCVAEAALGRIEGWAGLTPGVDLAARRRAFRIEQDLDALGGPRPIRSGSEGPLRMASLADGLGCLYVIEGSAIGGRVIAARARAALGPGLPTAFFADPDRNTGRDWKTLRATLDSFGAGQSDLARRSVIDAAHRTFDTFAATVVEGRSWP